MKKPDRFERIVLKKVQQLNTDRKTRGFRCIGCMEYPQVSELLRREHAWMRKMVKSWLTISSKFAKEAKTDNERRFFGSRELLCQSMLIDLNERRK